MNYLINTSRFKGHLLTIVLSYFVVGVFSTFSLDAFAESCTKGTIGCFCMTIEGKEVCEKITTTVPPDGTTTPPPNLADLVSFNALPSSESTVSLKWETASEHDNAGFNIWRAKLENDELSDITRVNEQIISSKNIFEWTGTSYSVEDTTLPNGNTYYYVLEDINNTGENTLQCDHISAVSLGEPLQKTDAIEKVKSICKEYAEEQSE